MIIHRQDNNDDYEWLFIGKATLYAKHISYTVENKKFEYQGTD